MNAATMAGVASTLMFAGSTLPMVVRAARTRDMSSYSRGRQEARPDRLLRRLSHP